VPRGGATEPTGLPLLDGLAALPSAAIEDYCRAAAEYIRQASVVGTATSKAAQIRLSNALAAVTVADLEGAGLDMRSAFTGERDVGGGLRTVKADVSEMSATDGLRLAVEIKPVHLAVGRAIWNRFGDVRTFAVNIHLKFPFAIVGGILTLPTSERLRSGDDAHWKSTAHLVSRAIGRFVRAGGRRTEGDAPHLLEGIAVVAFDHETGVIEPDLPPAGSGLRWPEFIAMMADVYESRFGDF
jgi:hypothetical protein